MTTQQNTIATSSVSASASVKLGLECMNQVLIHGRYGVVCRKSIDMAAKSGAVHMAEMPGARSEEMVLTIAAKTIYQAAEQGMQAINIVCMDSVAIKAYTVRNRINNGISSIEELMAEVVSDKATNELITAINLFVVALDHADKCGLRVGFTKVSNLTGWNIKGDAAELPNGVTVSVKDGEFTLDGGETFTLEQRVNGDFVTVSNEGFKGVARKTQLSVAKLLLQTWDSVLESLPTGFEEVDAPDFGDIVFTESTSL